MIACLAVLAGCVSLAMGRMKFINPPEAGRRGDFSQNPSYPYGSVVALAWTEAADNAATSLTLWQVNQNDGAFLGNMEYITREWKLMKNLLPTCAEENNKGNSISTTTFNWIVATSKDLTVSNIFFMSIFEEGQRVSDGDSQYFNMTRGSGSGAETEIPPQSTSAGPTPSPAEVPATSSIPASNEDERSPSQEVQEPAPDQSDESLDRSAIIGLAVALPCGIILSALGAWFFWGRRRRKTLQHKHLRDVRERRDSYEDGRGDSVVGLGLGYGPHEMYAPKGHAPAEQVNVGGKGFPAIFELATQR